MQPNQRQEKAQSMQNSQNKKVQTFQKPWNNPPPQKKTTFAALLLMISSKQLWSLCKLVKTIQSCRKEEESDFCFSSSK